MTLWAPVTTAAIPYADEAAQFGHRILSRQIPRRGYTLITWNCQCGAGNDRACKPIAAAAQMAEHIRWALQGG